MTRELRAALLGLFAYKALREEPLLKAVGNLLDGLAAGRGEEALGAYTDVVLALQELELLVRSHSHARGIPVRKQLSRRSEALLRSTHHRALLRMERVRRIL